MTHPKHELARYEKAKRVSYFLYSNDFESDLMEHAGKRLWVTVLKLAGEQVIKANGEEYEGSEATRALIVEMLKDREASGEPKGPSLVEINASGARDTSSWGTPAPDTVSDGSTPTSSLPTSEPPVPSEPLATSPAFRGEGRAAPTTTASAGASTENTHAVPALPTSRSKSVAASPTPPVSPRGRGGQASLPAFQRHSETSREAAIGVKARTDTLRLQVLNLLRERGPMTDEAIAQALDLPQNTARPRRVELVQMGSVIARGKASTASGRSAVTWDLVKFRVVCGWCPTLNVLEEGDRPEPVSHGICEACSQRIENERVSA